MHWSTLAPSRRSDPILALQRAPIDPVLSYLASIGRSSGLRGRARAPIAYSEPNLVDVLISCRVCPYNSSHFTGTISRDSDQCARDSC